MNEIVPFPKAFPFMRMEPAGLDHLPEVPTSSITTMGIKF
jgi:hypothetical protein